jgi:hypothetical protein
MIRTLADAHPELFHYTTLSGLDGIIRSQTIWATHASYLNDANEIRMFETRLVDILTPLIETSPSDVGNAAILAASMYQVLLEPTDHDAEPFAEPYIASFCTASNEKIAQHGLLSQWRGYGAEGGYAIVFDTRGLDDLLKEETRLWNYNTVFGGDIIYSHQENEFKTEFATHISSITSAIAMWRKDMKNPKPLEDTYLPFIQCACRYKHWGYQEEKEVRYVAIPMSERLLQAHVNRGDVVKDKPRHYFYRGGAPIPCLQLFDGVTKLAGPTLPIRRIIVGPHRDKLRRRRAIENLLKHYGLKIPVDISEIPYVGHG